MWFGVHPWLPTLGGRGFPKRKPLPRGVGVDDHFKRDAVAERHGIARATCRSCGRVCPTARHVSTQHLTSHHLTYTTCTAYRQTLHMDLHAYRTCVQTSIRANIIIHIRGGSKSEGDATLDARTLPRTLRYSRACVRVLPFVCIPFACWKVLQLKFWTAFQTPCFVGLVPSLFTTRSLAIVS